MKITSSSPIRIGTSVATLETQLRRLAQELGAVNVVTRRDRAARRFEFDLGGLVVVEIDALPIGNEIEIQIALISNEGHELLRRILSLLEESYALNLSGEWVALLAVYPLAEKVAAEGGEENRIASEILNQSLSPITDNTRRTEIRLSTESRELEIKQLKDAHPDWTQEKVATEAAQILKDPNITKETVRYIYRKNNWPWHRGSRIR